MHGLKKFYILSLTAIIVPSLWATDFFAEVSKNGLDPFHEKQQQSQAIEEQFKAVKKAIFEKGSKVREILRQMNDKTLQDLTVEIQRIINLYCTGVSAGEVVAFSDEITKIIETYYKSIHVLNSRNSEGLLEKISDEIESFIANRQFYIFFPED